MPMTVTPCGMNEGSKSPPLSVFVDLDNTLVFQSLWINHPARRELERQGHSPYKLSSLSPNRINALLPEGTRVFNSKGFVVAVRRRPHARAFLEALQGLVGPLCCLTMGRTAHQQKVLHHAGLNGHFAEVVGRDRFQDLVDQKGKDWLLIDDLPVQDPNLVKKLYALGIVSNKNLTVFDPKGPPDDPELDAASQRLVVVPSYDGEIEDDGLNRVMREVEDKIRTLGRVKGSRC